MFHKICKWGAIIWTVFCLIGVVVGMANVSGMTAANEYEQAGQAIGTALGLGFWGVLWFFPTAGLGILALVTRPKEKVIAVAETKLCRHCGKYYAGNPTFCPNCGSGLGAAE